MNTINIIQECKQNNYSAQLKVYKAYKNMMFGSAIRILKSRVEAEDIVQDCFIKAFQKIHQINNDANLGAWLKRIVVNKSLDVVRNKNKQIWLDDTHLLDTEIVAVEEELEPTISVDFIKECINKLKEKYRIILVLYLIEDYNHREIGEMLQIKESTVRNQYKRGKDQLLKMLKKQEVL